MATIFKHRRGTAAQWASANPILADGEPGFEKDTLKGKYGDGTTPWNSLAYSWGTPSSGSATGTNTGDQTLSISGKLLSISGANGNTVTLPAGGGGLSTVSVAASNANASDKAAATYTCTGTNDDITINTALQAVKTAGGIVRLSSGTFNISAPLYIEGQNTPNDAPNVALIGSGSEATNLVGASGIDVIVMRYMPKPKIHDLCITVSGAADAIKSIANTTGSNDRRGFWQGDFANIFVKGTNTHSGWVMNLENPFRSVFRNIQTGAGIGNGMWFKSNNPAFNAGNCIVMGCQMGLDGMNGVSYKLDSGDNGGFLNIFTFIECDSITTNASSTTSIGWQFVGSTTTYYTTRDILVLRANCENFNTAAKFNHSSNVELNFNFVNVANNGRIFDLSSDSTNNFLSAQYGYAGGNITASALYDQNTDILKPNVLRNSFIRVESGSTMTVTKTAATVLEKLARDSDGGTYPAEWQAAASPLVVKSAGTELFRGTKSINFGNGLSATASGADITVTATGTSASDATTTSKGIVQLSNDFAGTASAPTVVATHLTSALPISQGGTNSTTQAAALTSLTGTQTAGQYVRSDGTNSALGAIQAADVPILNQNTTGSAAKLTTARNLQTNLASTTAAPFDGTADSNIGVTGILSLANGGTGSATQNFVDLSTAQTTIAGAKTFTGGVTISTNSFAINAGFKAAVTSRTAAATLGTNSTLNQLVNATSAAVTITLPAVSGATGLTFRFKKTDSSANAVTVKANASELIDGANTKVLSSQYAAVELLSDGTSWNIM